MKGTLLIVGGGLRASADQVFSALIEKAGGPRSKIAFIVTASGEGPDELFRSYREDLVRLGLPEENCILVPIYAQHVRDERGYNAMTGDAAGLCSCLDGVTGVWFTGGDQYFTNQCLIRPDGSDTALLTRLREIYANGGVIGGSSAGAAIMSRVMIGSGNNRGVLAGPVVYGYADYDEQCEKDDPCDPLLLCQGLGFFTEGIVDQHFNKRPRLMRLIQACFSNREGVRMGYAVSEDTALVYHQGNIQVLGSAGVYLVDCRAAEQTGNGCCRGVVLHALHQGDSYDTASGAVCLAQPTPAKDKDFYPDYINDGIINSPVFDGMIEEKLLRGVDASLETDAESGLPCIHGAVAYDVHGRTFLVKLDYLRRPDTAGYRRDHTSFTNVGLCIRSVEVAI